MWHEGGWKGLPNEQLVTVEVSACGGVFRGERIRMGFLDNVTSAVNRGTAAAGRGADKIKLNARIGELNRQRQGLAAQLGASLYEATRGDAALVSGREALYDGIARIDAEREQCQRQIAAIDGRSRVHLRGVRGAHDWRRPVLLRLRHAGREGPGPGCPGVVRALGPCVRLLRGAARGGRPVLHELRRKGGSRNHR